jgi:hypothetical protein
LVIGHRGVDGEVASEARGSADLTGRAIEPVQDEARMRVGFDQVEDVSGSAGAVDTDENRLVLAGAENVAENAGLRFEVSSSVKANLADNGERI